jgi:hypothetical protein
MKKVSCCVLAVALGCLLAVSAQEKTVKAPPVLDINGSVQIQAQKALWGQ